MKKVGGLVGLIIALGVGYMIFKSQFTQGPAGGAPPQETIDVAGVKNDLIAIAQAERTYLAAHGAYAGLDELQKDGALAFSGANRRGYSYSAIVEGGQRFKVTAAPADPAKRAWPTLAIDETMQISTQ